MSEIQINVSTVSEKPLGQIRASRNELLQDIKQKIAKLPKAPKVERQALKCSPRDKTAADDATLGSLGLTNNATIYVKDLGMQVSYRGVFICEYLGPFVVYLIVATRPSILYGQDTKPLSVPAFMGLICWTFHYGKRLYESVMVHRFSHGTMPIRNLFKNCIYYWGFTLYIAYGINHPQYTPPPFWQMLLGAGIFFISELGNLSIHLLLRDLRPPGTKVRKIPVPNSNFLTKLFNYVSCPNYTYEVGAWIGYSIMTSSLPAFLFTVAGGGQMFIWARNKHKAYKKDFGNYPKQRKAMIPFIA